MVHTDIRISAELLSSTICIDLITNNRLVAQVPTIICNMKHVHVNADPDTRCLKPKRKGENSIFLFIPIPSWIMQKVKVQSDENDKILFPTPTFPSGKGRKRPTRSSRIRHSDHRARTLPHGGRHGLCSLRGAALPGPPCGLMANATLKYTPETYRCSPILRYPTFIAVEIAPHLHAKSGKAILCAGCPC